VSETTLKIEHTSPWLEAGDTVGGMMLAVDRFLRMGAPLHALLQVRTRTAGSSNQVQASWTSPATEDHET
jgi:hypothetical protein